MRSRPSTLLLAALLLALAPAIRAGTVAVDPGTRTVNTSKLGIMFDTTVPDLVVRVYNKDYDPAMTLTTFNLGLGEFWGQVGRNTSTPGYIMPFSLTTSDWTVTRLTPSLAEIVTRSQSPGQPLVETRYRFFADQPYYTLDRTIRFSTQPDTAAYQAYEARMSELFPYRAVRWRDTTGTLIQRGFCAAPCIDTNWNGRWLELLQMHGVSGFAIASIFPASLPARTPIVRGYGQTSETLWASPLVTAGTHARDVTWSQMIAFSVRPDNTSTFDSLWVAYNSGGFAVDVGAETRANGLSLSVSPNPSRLETLLEWTAPVAGVWTLDVLDVSGRKVAELDAGWVEAGPHGVRWDGRGRSGHDVKPGLYFVRCTGPAGTRVARLVRTN